MEIQFLTPISIKPKFQKFEYLKELIIEICMIF